MLRSERTEGTIKDFEKRKFPLICPHCKHEQTISNPHWLLIFDELDHVGKAVLWCVTCQMYYLIREEDDSGPFITKGF